MENKGRKFLWFAVFLVLVALTLHTLTKQDEAFTHQRFQDFVAGASWEWLVLAFLSMIGFIVFEGLALWVLLRAFGYQKKVSRNMAYSAMDIYFSAITPSATGGQPAAAYFMMKDKVPGAVTTITLLINVTLYTISIIAVSVLCILARPGIFMEFGSLSKCMIVIGFAVQLVLVVVFILLVYKEKIVMRIASAIMRILSRLHLMKNVEKRQKRLKEVEAQYKACATAIKYHKKSLALALLFNFLQRISLIMVSVCVFIAVGGDLTKTFDVFITQGYVFTGSNSIPIPGAVGVADFLFIDGFRCLVDAPVNLELLSRGISFYSCLILCGIISLVVYISEVLKGMRRKKNDRDL